MLSQARAKYFGTHQALTNVNSSDICEAARKKLHFLSTFLSSSPPTKRTKERLHFLEEHFLKNM